jgi:DNA-binding transcriptional regulator YiaG
MNELEVLKKRIAKELPNATLELEAPSPARTDAAWWLDAEFHGHDVSIEWKPKRGFGLTSPAEGFGHGAEEVYHDVGAAAKRVVELLQGRERTRPPVEAALSVLRQNRHISQEELAAALQIRQATVSKWERRPDMHVSTLRKAVAAMGGELEISARFPDGIVRITQVGESRITSKK